MVEIPDERVAQRIIAEALEWGEYKRFPDTVGLGEYGQHDHELKAHIGDLDPTECEVDMVDESTVVVHGEITGSYSIQRARRTRHHPAEYESKEQPIGVSIELDLSEPGAPQVVGELL